MSETVQIAVVTGLVLTPPHVLSECEYIMHTNDRIRYVPKEPGIRSDSFVHSRVPTQQSTCLHARCESPAMGLQCDLTACRIRAKLHKTILSLADCINLLVSMQEQGASLAQRWPSSFCSMAILSGPL